MFQPHELEKNLFEKEVFNLFLIEALFLSIKIIKWLIHKQRIFICQTSKQHHQREDGKEKYYNSFCSLKIDPFLKQNFFLVVWHAYSWHILLHYVSKKLLDLCTFKNTYAVIWNKNEHDCSLTFKLEIYFVSHFWHDRVNHSTRGWGVTRHPPTARKCIKTGTWVLQKIVKCFSVTPCTIVLLQKSWTTIQQHPHSLIIAANKKEFAAVVNKVLSLPLSMQIRRALMWW